MNSLGNGLATFTKSKIPVSRLQVGRDRVVNQRVDTVHLEVLAKCVAPLAANHEQVIDRLRPLCSIGQDYIRIGQLLHIQCRHAPPPLVPFIQVGEFYAQNGCLNLVEPAVKSPHLVVVLFPRAVISKDSHSVSQFTVVRGYCATVAERPEVFPWIETPAGDVRQAADALSLIASTVSLRCVIQNPQLVLACNLENWVHICGLSVKVNRDDGPGAVGSGGLKLAWVHVVGITTLTPWPSANTCGQARSWFA